MTNTLTTPAVSAEIVAVTPALAQEWLGRNTSNRKLKPGAIAAFAADMKAGRWQLNGEAIKLSGPAYAPTKLLDGQNRLHALMKAGVTVPLLVVFGVPKDAQGTMDSGTKRTVADNLGINGVANAHVVASAAALALRAQNGKLAGGPMNATNAAVEEFIEENPGVHQSAVIAVKYANKADVPKSLVAYTHWVFAQIDPVDAMRFWRDAAEKVGLPAGDPVIALTNRFAQARRVREKVSAEQGVAAIFRAWNNRRDGKSVNTVIFNSRTGGAVAMPKLK